MNRLDFSAVKHTILIWSKYHIRSNRLKNIVKQHNLAFIQLFCGDSHEAKEVLRNTTYNISRIPCILVIYIDGNWDKYEANKAEALVEEYVSNLAENVNVPPRLQPQYPSTRPSVPHTPGTSTAIRPDGRRPPEGALPSSALPGGGALPPMPTLPIGNIDQVTTLDGLPLNTLAEPEMVSPSFMTANPQTLHNPLQDGLQHQHQQLKPMDIDPSTGRVVSGGPPPVPKDPPTDKGLLLSLSGMSESSAGPMRGPEPVRPQSDRSKSLMAAAQAMAQQRGL